MHNNSRVQVPTRVHARTNVLEKWNCDGLCNVGLTRVALFVCAVLVVYCNMHEHKGALNYYHIDRYLLQRPLQAQAASSASLR